MQPATDLPTLRTFREVCGQLRISERTARYQLAEGTFPVEPVRIGRQLFFRPTDIDRFIQGDLCV